jgi:hypothetical protein
MATNNGQGEGNSTQLEYDKLELEAWKKTIEVQQHFNDLELRIRNIAVTVLAGVFGAVALALQDGRFLIVAFLLFAGLIAWLSFYFMDRFWYHQLLKGAVVHAQNIENRLQQKIPGIGLSLAISEASQVRLFGVVVRSNRRLDSFYMFIATLLGLGSIVFLTIGLTIFVINLPKQPALSSPRPTTTTTPQPPTATAILPTVTSAPPTPTIRVTPTP